MLTFAAPMKRFFLEIAYNGANYHGWQIQKNANSVQATIQQALSTVLKEEIAITGAGRTDTGVHAKQLFAHFETTQDFDTEKLKFKLNSLLNDDIACFKVFEVEQDMHTRFSATSRTYEYWVSTQKNPFLTHFAYYFPFKLNVELMNKAANQLIQETDFSCFSKSKTDTFTNNCSITEAYWKTENDVLIFTITANRFLRNMVRSIVGTLLDVGQEKIATETINNIIESKNRSEAGQSVPAHGLYLTKIKYPFLNNEK